MREILFRGFNIDENGTEVIYLNGEEIKGKWVYGYLLEYSSGNKKIAIPSCRKDLMKKSNCVYGIYDVIPETVGQYTGLKDKNGRKIFENDIVIINNDIASMFGIGTKGKVEYVNGAFKVDSEGKDMLNLLYTLIDITGVFRGEVVETIFDKEVK